MDCEHGSDPQCCVVCGPYAKQPESSVDRAIREVTEDDMSRSFPARYDGYCAVFDHPIERGDVIVMVDDQPAHRKCVKQLTFGLNYGR